MLNSLWLISLIFVPAGIANMAPVFAARVPGLRQWNAPMDGGLTWRGKRVLGDHKTWRGLLIGIIAAILTEIILFQFGNNSGTAVSPVMLGALLGAGALIGDSVKSFFKRRAGVAPGKSWLPFDQIDYILGAIAFSYFYFSLPAPLYLLILVLGFVLHLVIVYIGYLLNIREQAI